MDGSTTVSGAGRFFVEVFLGGFEASSAMGFDLFDFFDFFAGKAEEEAIGWTELGRPLDAKMSSISEDIADGIEWKFNVTHVTFGDGNNACHNQTETACWQLELSTE